MKRLFSLLLILVLMLGMLPTSASAEGTAPQTDASGAYLIGTGEELLWFAQTVNGGDTDISALLTADIDLTGINWPGIGASENRFGGSFDGQDHTVTFGDGTWGLFRYVLGNSEKLASVSNVRTKGSIKSSGIACNAGYAQFTRCINGATITTSSSYVAGIVGDVSTVRMGNGQQVTDVRITQCGNEASITAGENIGGILGSATANTRIEYCYNTGRITGTQNVGGLAGYLQAATGSTYVRNSYNTGAVYCSIQGKKITGGIAGHLHNSVKISNCYNSGVSDYAIVSSRYNSTAVIENCYYLGTSSYKCSEDFFETRLYHESTSEINSRAVARTANQLASIEMESLLRGEFKQSCPTPVLNWQQAKSHSGDVCNNFGCGFGHTDAESYWVTFQESSVGGYTITYDSEKATNGVPYTFTIAVSDGFQMNDAFRVKINGEAIDFVRDGSKVTCTVPGDKVTGPLSVTVFGVEQNQDVYAIKHPPAGYGFTIEAPVTTEQTATSVKREKDYHFTVRFKEGFSPNYDFQVIARSSADGTSRDLPLDDYTDNGDGSYSYVIPDVKKNYEIVITGVKADSSKTVTVDFTVTQGFDKFYQPDGWDSPMIYTSVTVPYFDLSLYDLEQYYYNPYCYATADGLPQSIQRAGTPEVAYNNITVMHAYIVATELFCLGYQPDQVGQGLYKTDYPNAFTSGAADSVISWTQGPGSSFMKFWHGDSNLNYYVNYEYPLGYPGWGSTADQILLNDGDDVSVHLIEGAGSGSRYGIFTVNDRSSKFRPTTPRDEWSLYQNEKVELTLYWTNTSGNYNTLYQKIPNQTICWIDADNLTSNNIQHWNTGPLPREAVLAQEDETEPVPMQTDDNGKILIDTTGVVPGTYYLAVKGFFTEGGEKDNAGFVSTGAEAGAAIFKLTVLEYEGMVGDVNGDLSISAVDAGLVLQHVAKLTESMDAGAADVNGDGVISAVDAGLILQYVAKLIDTLPPE